MEISQAVRVKVGAMLLCQIHAFQYLMRGLVGVQGAIGMVHHAQGIIHLAQAHIHTTQDAQELMEQVAQEVTTQEIAQEFMEQAVWVHHHVQVSHMQTVHLRQDALRLQH